MARFQSSLPADDWIVKLEEGSLECLCVRGLKPESTGDGEQLRHVDEGVYVALVPLDVFVVDEPLDLLLDHLLLR